jgi:hypothetical protein
MVKQNIEEDDEEDDLIEFVAPVAMCSGPKSSALRPAIIS